MQTSWPNREELWRQPSFVKYFEGARARARQLGYLVEEFWLHEAGMTPEKLQGIFKARAIQALLIAPQPHAHIHPEIDFSGYSAVAFGYSMKPAILNTVTNHQFHSMNLLLSNLVKLGYRRPGLWFGKDWDEKVDNAWMGGYLVAHWKHPGQLELLPPYLGSPEMVFKEWLQEQQPDVVISHDGMERELRKLGYKVPQQIGFASLDLNVEKTHLSGINQNSFRIGQKAVDVLVAMIHRGERCIPEIPTRTLVESVWVPGETLRKQRPKRTGKGSVPSRSP